MLGFIKYDLIFYITNDLLMYFNSFFINNTETFLYKLNLNMFLRGDENIYEYVFLKTRENRLFSNIYIYEYSNINLSKYILYWSNLPVFFYFGLIFILTTLSSFFLLSYLGLYGVFFLNLVSILLF